MLKKIFLLILVSFFISAIEIYSINSSPLLGQADINDLKVREDKIKELKVDLEYYTSTSDIYEKLYEIRPHRTDINKDAYKMISLRLGINDLMKYGVILYEMGIFSICGKEKEIGENESKFIQHLSQYGPRAVSSNFDPNVSTYLEGSIPIEKWKDKHGKKLTLMPLGWFILSEMMGGNSLLFFEEKCSEINNVSHEKFLEGYTELYRLIFARLSFVESVLDEKSSWQGIYYLAYYPKFDKVWIVTKSIPEREILDSYFLLDGEKVNGEIMYPFIFVNVSLEEGDHTLQLITKQRTYKIEFKVEFSPILLASEQAKQLR